MLSTSRPETIASDRQRREQRDLLAHVLRQPALGAADQHVRRDTDAAQLVDRVLRRLGLELARVADVGHEREVDEHRVAAADVHGELADRLQERQRLDVAHRAADLGDHDVDVLRLADQPDPVLDLVRDVRDDLHGAAEVVAAALLADDRVVDRAGGDVRGARRVRVRVALVVAEVEVGLRAVLGDEHLAVLERRHRPGIDVDVRIELLQRDLQAARDEQPADGGGGDALPERRDHSPSDEDVTGSWPGFGHAFSLKLSSVRIERRCGGDQSCGLEQLFRVAAGGRVLAVGAEHPDDLADDVGLAQLGDGRAGGLARGVLDDREVAVGQRRDLRQVRDADDLAAGGERAQLLADRAGGLAADAGVDLVEDQRRRARPRPRRPSARASPARARRRTRSRAAGRPARPGWARSGTRPRRRPSARSRPRAARAPP